VGSTLFFFKRYLYIVKITELYSQIICESLDNIWYHGTSGLFPFQSFSHLMDGMGVVNTGRKKFGGFFFTDVIDNAEFYSENFVAKVRIHNLIPAPDNQKHPPTVMQLAIKDKKSYVVSDVLDGSHYSNIAVVPISNLKNVVIMDWVFIGDKDFYYSSLDEFFGGDEEDKFISRSIIDSFINMTGGGLDYLLKVPVFKSYYFSKTEG